MERNDKVRVSVRDLASVLCGAHNLLSGITERSLRDMLNGKQPDDKLKRRVSAIKADIIDILAGCTENGSKIDSNVTPFVWQEDDIVKQLGGAK